MTISTVFFDVGKTLLTPAVPENEVVAQAAASLGATVDAAVVKQNMPRMYERYEELYEADNSLWADEERAAAIWINIYEYMCELLEIPQLGPQIARTCYERFLDPASWALYDDVIPTLFALKSRRVSIGLISNWDCSLENIIDGMGIRFYFDVVISSAVVGLHKPQPEIFKLALAEAQAFASEAMHVGDHLQADVGGAAAVGITPVLIDRTDRYADVEGCIRVKDLRDIIAYL